MFQKKEPLDDLIYSIFLYKKNKSEKHFASSTIQIISEAKLSGKHMTVRRALRSALPESACDVSVRGVIRMWMNWWMYCILKKSRSRIRQYNVRSTAYMLTFCIYLTIKVVKIKFALMEKWSFLATQACATPLHEYVLETVLFSTTSRNTLATWQAYFCTVLHLLFIRSDCRIFPRSNLRTDIGFWNVFQKFSTIRTNKSRRGL